MKLIKFFTVGVLCFVFSSCGLLKSASQLPGSLMQSVGRTAGMNVNHEEPSESAQELQEENKIY